MATRPYTRPVRPARIIRFGTLDKAPTQPIDFDREAAASAWIAEMRIAQAGR
jgi:hypothetical protein